MKKTQASPILLLGWDAADWQFINALQAEGLMPNLKRLREYGSEAYLASLIPTLSPLLWTSIATGKRPHEHGILSFVENTMEGVQAVSSNSRKVPAIWNILDSAGLRSKIYNWWPSHPVEAINGEMVAQPFFWKEEGEYLWPKDRNDLYKSILNKPFDLEALRLFFPHHSAQDLEADPLVQQVAKIIERSSHQLNVALEGLEPGDFDFGALYFEALDQIKHLAIKYHPPQMEGIADEDFYRYQNIVTAAYQWFDLMLGSILKRIGSNCNIILVSDHGFSFDIARQLELSDHPAAPATEHRPYGILLTAGPDFNSDTAILGAGLLDIMPNILHHFSLPVGWDMEGRIWKGLERLKKETSYIPTWDSIISDYKLQYLESSSRHMLEDLEQLDYLDLSTKAEGVKEEVDYNKALSMQQSNMLEESLAISKNWSKKSGSAFRWIMLEARLILENSDHNYRDWFQSIDSRWRESLPLRFYLSLDHLQRGDSAEALRELQELEELGLASPVFFAEMGQALFLAGHLKQAKTYFEKALDLDSQSARSMNGLAQIAFSESDFSNFEIWANRALELKYFQPQLHFLWALHFDLQNEVEARDKALALCLQMAPKHQKALALMNKIKGISNAEATVIVSGFPRSGTSMMMAILKQAGIPLIIDEERQADLHNIKGYFEYEPIKRLAQGIEWPSSAGKALKVVAPLIPYLPPDQNYKVIWMERPIVEVILSQAKMKGEAMEMKNFPFAKGQQYESEKKRLQKFLDQQPHMEWESFSMGDFLESNAGALAKSLSEFLGLELKASHIEKVVDPKMRHQHIG